MHFSPEKRVAGCHPIRVQHVVKGQGQRDDEAALRPDHEQQLRNWHETVLADEAHPFTELLRKKLLEMIDQYEIAFRNAGTSCEDASP